MESLKKSLRTHRRRFSGSSGGGTPRSQPTSHEELPILSDDLHLDINDDVNDPRGNTSEPVLSREPSVEFWRGGAESGGGHDSSSSSSSDETLANIVVGEGGRSNQSMCREVSLDMDVDTEEISHGGNGSIRQRSLNKDLRVSFDQPVSSENAAPAMAETPRIWQPNSPCFDKSSGSDTDEDEAEVLQCTSNRSFHATSMLRLKTRSRLLDPPDDADCRSTCLSRQVPKSGPIGKSSQFFSGLVGKSGPDEEDEETWEEDMPEEYKKVKVSFFFLLQWAVLIAIIGSLIATLVIPRLKQKVIWKLKLWKWLLLFLVFVCGRLVAGWGIRVIVFFIERNFVLRKKLLYFVYGVRDPVQNCLWLGMVLVAWICLLNKTVERDMNGRNLKYVTKVLVCLLVGTVLWLVKTLIIKVMASSFHVSTYFDRIQESLFSQYVIETLSGPPILELEHIEEEENKIANDIRILEDAGATVPPELKAAGLGIYRRSNAGPGRSMRFSRVPSIGSNNLNSGRISMDKLQNLNTQNVSAWKMKRMMKIVRKGLLLSTLDEQIGRTQYEDETTMMIRSEKEAKAVAKRIFQNVARPRSRYIYLDDLIRFMSEEEALKTLYLCGESTDAQRISKSCLKNWLVNAFRDRKALTLTLNDTKTAVNKLHRVVNVLISIVILVIWLLILEIASSKFLMFTVSELVLFVFMFGNTCKTAFESVIFLFVIHPFDVGDRCEIDGVQMVVEEMNILNTIFLRYDNQKVMFPNSTLSLRPIGNYYRSPDMGDGIEFFVHMATPAEKINLMKQKIISYIENKKEHWFPAPMVIVKEFEDLNRIRMAVWLCHTINHQDMGEKFARRALLMEEMIKIFKEMDLQYRFLPLDINVRSMPPATTSRLPPTWVVNTA